MGRLAERVSCWPATLQLKVLLQLLLLLCVQRMVQPQLRHETLPQQQQRRPMRQLLMSQQLPGHRVLLQAPAAAALTLACAMAWLRPPVLCRQGRWSAQLAARAERRRKRYQRQQDLWQQRAV